jgi:hypothetical protein
MVAVGLLYGVWLLIIGELMGAGLSCCARGVLGGSGEKGRRNFSARERLLLSRATVAHMFIKSYRSERVRILWSCLFLGTAVWTAWLGWRDMVISISPESRQRRNTRDCTRLT